MTGNAVFHFSDTSILSVVGLEAPIVVTSTEIDEQLSDTYTRLDMNPGALQGLAGIEERRWWPEGVSFADAAADAGRKALAEAGVDPSRIGVLIDTSVCRDHLEPSAAVDVHEQLGLPSSCLNFDLANACLGFMNGMHLAGTLIDSGQVDYALIVDGEGSRAPQQATIQRLQGPDVTRGDVLANFATLTLGSASAAMVLGRTSAHPEGHRFVGGVSRADTSHKALCVGDLNQMTTDSRGLLDAAVVLAQQTWTDAGEQFDWADLNTYVIHQVSKIHTAAIAEAVSIDAARIPTIFEMFGNIGPASIPFTLARESANLSAGDRIACMGIGSGINAMVIEIEW